MIHITGPNQQKPPEGSTTINTTSRSFTWSKSLSPFFCGPVELYGGYESVNVENAWQFSKVYEYYLEEDGSVGERYFQWAQDGWKDTHAHRYPMGKGVVPAFSYWDYQKLTYVEARKKIYIPLYSQAVQKTSAFEKLKKLHEEGADLYLWDFDGYDHKALNLSYNEVINNPDRKMGHAFVIGMLLEGFIK
jgi:uncharacterized protein DUF6939